MATGSLLTLATATVLATGSIQAEKASDFSDIINVGGAQVESIQKNTRIANEKLLSDTQPILLAQANIEDGRTGPYSAIVPQLKGGSKMVEYYKNKRGLIIPPPIENGKLADGSDAPVDPIEAKAEQRSVIAKYAKVVLVKTEKKDLVVKASREIGDFTTLAEQSKLDKNGLYKGFSTTYLVKLGLGNEATTKNIEGLNTILTGFEKYGRIILKMNNQEIEQMKKKAEQEAQDKINTLNPSAA